MKDAAGYDIVMQKANDAIFRRLQREQFKGLFARRSKEPLGLPEGYRCDNESSIIQEVAWDAEFYCG